jgi:hypothetical protein
MPLQLHYDTHLTLLSLAEKLCIRSLAHRAYPINFARDHHTLATILVFICRIPLRLVIEKSVTPCHVRDTRADGFYEGFVELATWRWRQRQGHTTGNQYNMLCCLRIMFPRPFAWYKYTSDLKLIQLLDGSL